MDYVAGFGFQIGLPELLVALAILGLLLFGIWTVIKMVWAAMSG
jgi:prepilin-type N-terminal cleavage/methylation domain-containing protein